MPRARAIRYIDWRRLVTLALVLAAALPLHGASRAAPTRPPTDAEVAFNTQTLIYHAPRCRWALRCTKHCVDTSRANAIRLGGRPCKVCKGGPR